MLHVTDVHFTESCQKRARLERTERSTISIGNFVHRVNAVILDSVYSTCSNSRAQQYKDSVILLLSQINGVTVLELIQQELGTQDFQFVINLAKRWITHSFYRVQCCKKLHSQKLHSEKLHSEKFPLGQSVEFTCAKVSDLLFNDTRDTMNRFFELVFYMGFVVFTK